MAVVAMRWDVYLDEGGTAAAHGKDLVERNTAKAANCRAGRYRIGSTAACFILR